MLLLRINGIDRIMFNSTKKAGTIEITYRKSFSESQIPDYLEEVDAETGELVPIAINEDRDSFYIEIPSFGVDAVIAKKNFVTDLRHYKNRRKPYHHLRFIEYLEKNNFKV